MRAKRSKKYRKIMATYNLQFAFRTPYQVLCDSDFLRNCHAFKMPIHQFLSNTLHGECRPYITQCSLASITEQHARKVRAGQEQKKGRGDGKPEWLPLPTDVPLRYCKHKDEEGKDVGNLGEADCLIDLLAGQVKGNEVAKNKQHYVLATAETEAAKEGKRRKGPEVRELARMIPGVPIVYVKRSVMILEELSAASDRSIRGIEKEKFKEGLIMNTRGLKRKREDDDSEDEDDASMKRGGGPKIRGLRKPKAPNPLSVMKKKPKVAQQKKTSTETITLDGDSQQKKTRRKRGNKQQPDRKVEATSTE